MAGRPKRTVKIEDLRDLMIRLFVAAGSDRSNAETSAEIFLEADLRGINFQGLDHMPDMVRGLRNGKIKGDGKPEIVKEGDAFILIDGNRGPGHAAAIFACDRAVAKAKTAGAVVAGIRNSSDMYAVGIYADRIARAGCIGMVWSDATPTCHPYGGAERVTGTNPISFSMPTAGHLPYVFEMSTSALSMSRVRHAAYHDENVPDAHGMDKNGQPTVVAKAIREGGSIGPLGGPKGSGLSMFVGFLSGLLPGCATGKSLIPWHHTTSGQVGAKGHFIVAIDPGAFGDADAFRKRVSEHLSKIKGSKKAPGVSEIRIPGENSLGIRARQLQSGNVSVLEATWQNTAKLAAELGVAMPQ